MSRDGESKWWDKKWGLEILLYSGNPIILKNIITHRVF